MLDDAVPDDAFDTAGIRGRVLAAWAASPARFREDANAEEDYALGGYRDRVVVELAQNAADAAARAGLQGGGRLRLTLRPDGTLIAANTGAPLDADGVEGLSTLRASAKRDETTVGRFGVGFAAVVAVSDEPRIVSRTGAVRWSRAESRDLAMSLPALRAELEARGGNVPVLRLPFPADPSLPLDGFDTAVILPLRDEATVSLVERLLTEAGPALLLALPALAEVTIEAGDRTRTLTATRHGDLVTIKIQSTPQSQNAPAPSPPPPALTTWLTVTSGGPLDPALLADRPVEERARPEWSVQWAVPVAPGGGATDVGAALDAAADGSAAVPTRLPDGGDAALGAATGGGATDVGAALGGATGGGATDVGTALGSRALGGTALRGAAVPTRLPDGVPAVVHAPTPSDEPLGLPALLLASFPLTPDRRHVAPGPLTDFLVERAADAYGGLLPDLAPGHGLLDMVPGPVASGELDVRLRQAILGRLPGVPFLPRAQAPVAEAPLAEAPLDGAPLDGAPARPAATRVTQRDALLLDVAAPPGLASYLAGLLPGLISGPSRHPAYATLGIRRIPLAEIADTLTTVERPPSWWRGLYAALAGVDPQALSELGALPVPLADGRLIRGPRGVLLPGPGLDHPSRLAPLRLRVADPGAVHPLLARLGALEATPRGVLDHPATIAAVDASLDEEDPEPIADAVLHLVTAAGVAPGEFPWLADLALPASDGEWDPAGDLLLPGGELAQVVADDADLGVADPRLVERYGPDALAAVGVLSSFGLLTEQDVSFGDAAHGALTADDEPGEAAGLDLDGAADWAENVRAQCDWSGDGPVPPVAVEVTAVRDLDLVDPARWPRALEIITTRPRLRAALLRPVTVRLPDGTHADVPSYTAWWLRTHPVLAGRRPDSLRAAGADPVLAGLYDDAAELAATDPGVAALLADAAVARALGIRASLAGLLAEPGGPDDLLDRLADPVRAVSRQDLRSLWVALATVPDPGLNPPARIRAIHGERVVVASAGDVLVLDSPDLWPLAASRPLVLAPYDLALVLAELLDIPVASEQVAGRVDTPGERRAVPALVHAVFPDAPETYLAHDKLLVDGVPVPWRCADGEVHASTPGGLASGLAWASGQWSARHLLTTLLSSPDEAARLLAEADLDPL